MPSTSTTETQKEMVQLLYSSFFCFNLRISDPVYSVTLSVSNLANSMQYWNQLLGMKIYSQSETSATLGYGDDQVCMLLYICYDICLV